MEYLTYNIQLFGEDGEEEIAAAPEQEEATAKEEPDGRREF